ncbi:MAG: hypothetical protein IT423_17870 [Pirellulaceae bacterium]|nr:hypothetical protein [Pirellulaceae bacterium]
MADPPEAGVLAAIAGGVFSPPEVVGLAPIWGAEEEESIAFGAFVRAGVWAGLATDFGLDGGSPESDSTGTSTDSITVASSSEITRSPSNADRK